ncbi:hypothetical protein [Desulfogranum marinum]|uniref:hypothetical protein n=1 Tax=Desulfogranum marinum TaxID=453220 RepID=UPI0019651C70|nr:hypothetical protein [Desulfogranum marinum]MBM9510957.1 hypothetical protein [Desulfogranum marinum]
MNDNAHLKRRGIIMVFTFIAVLAIIFTPIFPGTNGQKVNGLNYLDNFFNQLAKGSAYYIEEQMQEAQSYAGTTYSASLVMGSPQQAERVASLLTVNRISANAVGVELDVKGDFADIITIILEDADLMYDNVGNVIAAKYDMNELAVLHGWYLVLQAMERDLNQAKKFSQAKFLKKSMSKAVEPAYNFYKVEVKPVKEGMVLLAGALIFYVLYTVWYGFGLLYIFEGMGIKLEH